MFKIIKTGYPDYPFNVQRWTKSNGIYYYAGVGRFCRNLAEVKAYCRSFWKDSQDFKTLKAALSPFE